MHNLRMEHLSTFQAQVIKTFVGHSTLIITLLVGMLVAILAAIVSIVLLRSKLRAAKLELKALEEKQVAVQHSLEEGKIEKISLLAENRALDQKYSQALQKNNELVIANTEQKDKLKTLEVNLNTLTNKFANFSENFATSAKNSYEEALKAARKELLQESAGMFNKTKTDLEETLKKQREIFNNTVGTFQGSATTINNSNQQALTKLQTQIELLAKKNNEITQTTTNLTNALYNNNKVIGNWGERSLKTLLEAYGFRKNYQYKEQQTSTTADGKKSLRPDFIIHLPNDRIIVVDSKVSLKAFVEYSSVAQEQHKTCDAERLKELEQIAYKWLLELKKNLKDHIDDLASKEYQKAEEYNKKTIDGVFMYLPLEQVYFLLYSKEEFRELLIYAKNKKIVIVGQSNLIPLLEIVDQLWHVEQKQKNIDEIHKLAVGMHDQFVGLAEEFNKVEKNFETAQKSFAVIKTKLSGQQGIVPKLEKLKDLGVRSNKNIPKNFKSEEPEHLAAAEPLQLISLEPTTDDSSEEKDSTPSVKDESTNLLL